MLPLLNFAADGKPHNITEAVQFISEQFKLNDLDRKELLPSCTIHGLKNWLMTILNSEATLG